MANTNRLSLSVLLWLSFVLSLSPSFSSLPLMLSSFNPLFSDHHRVTSCSYSGLYSILLYFTLPYCSIPLTISLSLSSHPSLYRFGNVSPNENVYPFGKLSALWGWSGHEEIGVTFIKDKRNLSLRNMMTFLFGRYHVLIRNNFPLRTILWSSLRGIEGSITYHLSDH